MPTPAYAPDFDPAAHVAQGMTARALQEDLAAFQRELNAKRLTLIAGRGPKDEKNTLAALAAAADDQARKARKRATRAKGATGATLKAPDVAAQRRAWLVDYHRQISAEHASHAAMKAEVERQLALKGNLALDADERAQADQALLEHDTHLMTLDAALEVVVAEIAALG